MMLKNASLFLLMLLVFGCGNTSTSSTTSNETNPVPTVEQAEIELDENGNPTDTVQAEETDKILFKGYDSDNPAPAKIVMGKINDEKIISLNEVPKEGVGYQFDINGFDLSNEVLLNNAFRKCFGSTMLNTLDRNVTITFSPPLTNSNNTLDKVNGYLANKSKELNEFLEQNK